MDPSHTTKYSHVKAELQGRVESRKHVLWSTGFKPHLIFQWYKLLNMTRQPILIEILPLSF